MGWGPRVAVTTAGVAVVKPAEGRAVVIADNPADVLTAGIANLEVRTVTNFPEWMVEREACIHQLYEALGDVNVRYPAIWRIEPDSFPRTVFPFMGGSVEFAFVQIG